MAITALVLLRMPPSSTSERVTALTDGVILHSELDFSLEPEALSQALVERLGEALFAHEDPRGIFFIPSVAAPRAQSYEAVIAEVGEGGVWGPSPLSLMQSDDSADLGALLGGMLAQLPPSLAASAQAAMSGDPAALAAMGAEVQALIGAAPALTQMLAQLTGEQAAEPGEQGPESPLPQLMREMQEQLMSDPSKLEQLMQQMFGDPKK